MKRRVAPPAAAEDGAAPGGSLLSERHFQELSKFAVPAGFRGRSGLTFFAWQLVQGSVFRLSPQFAHSWRASLLRAFGAQVGTNVRIRPSARITYPWKVVIGDNSWIGDRAELYSLMNITIGHDTCISQDAYLCTGSHDMEAADFRYQCEPIVVGDECWIAAGAFIAPGVSIGDAAVVGARSMVLKSLDGAGVYLGSPARFVRKR